MGNRASFLDFLGDDIELEFESCGYRCFVVLRTTGLCARCGYVLVPKTHPVAKRISYADIDVDVHGGITYMRRFDDGMLLGFDCMHSGDLFDIDAYMKAHPDATEDDDLVLAYMKHVSGLETCFYEPHLWTEKDVRMELESLAGQLREMEP